MKYLLLIHMNPDIWSTLTQDDIDEVMSGHDQFIKHITETGELIRTDALGQPAQSAVVRVRQGAPTVTDGPYVEAKEFLAGFYFVECDTKERALELAGMIPDAKWNAIEVRPIVHTQEK
ncbi:YciI family protein [Dactylosporangium sp. NPDC051541]|uniref:YciI family protein n=1 Tax=Dactylosporangium sp. NPDC051541 TaxID=3363977 RepID=UPI0037905C0D